MVRYSRASIILLTDYVCARLPNAASGPTGVYSLGKLPPKKTAVRFRANPTR